MEFTTTRNKWRLILAVSLSVTLVSAVAAQSPQVAATLTLAQAEAIALKNQPQIASANLRARALSKMINEAQSAYYPTIVGNLTGALVADPGTAIAAGNLTTSSVSDRFAVGGALLQMVTDFGRTAALVHKTQFQAKEQSQTAVGTREQVLLGVVGSYYEVLSSEAVLKATQSQGDEDTKKRKATGQRTVSLARG